MSEFKFPDASKRTVISGRTGSGKTQFGVWLLSHMDYKKRPWIIFDYKGDTLLNSIGAKELSIGTIPKKPGLYIVHPTPEFDDEKIDKFLWAIWAKGGIGIYIDEGYMIPRNSPAFSTILTQGRSLEIPAIILSQRPVWMNRFVYSEADYYAVFQLNWEQDRKRVESYIPSQNGGSLLDKRLPQYHCYWYDVAEDEIFLMTPVPERDSIIARFIDKSPVRFKFF